MSDRAVAGLILLAPTALCWWLAWSYVRDGEIYSARAQRALTRAAGPKRFWTAVTVTALLGGFTFVLALLALLG